MNQRRSARPLSALARQRWMALAVSVLSVTCTALVGVNAQEQAERADAQESAVSEADVLRVLHRSNQMEIELGQLAADRAGTAEVRRLGERLVRDHRFADGRVQALAAELGEALPADETRGEHRETFERLQVLEGGEFDRMYLQAMARMHAKTLDDLQQAEDLLGQSPVRNLVREVIPILEQHFEIARTLQKDEGA